MPEPVDLDAPKGPEHGAYLIDRQPGRNRCPYWNGPPAWDEPKWALGRSRAICPECGAKVRLFAGRVDHHDRHDGSPHDDT